MRTPQTHPEVLRSTRILTGFVYLTIAALCTAFGLVTVPVAYLYLYGSNEGFTIAAVAIALLFGGSLSAWRASQGAEHGFARVGLRVLMAGDALVIFVVAVVFGVIGLARLTS